MVLICFICLSIPFTIILQSYKLKNKHGKIKFEHDAKFDSEIYFLCVKRSEAVIIILKLSEKNQ